VNDADPKPFVELSVMLVNSDYGDTTHFRYIYQVSLTSIVYCHYYISSRNYFEARTIVDNFLVVVCDYCKGVPDLNFLNLAGEGFGQTCIL